jgi:dienelactone hydrolase
MKNPAASAGRAFEAKIAAGPVTLYGELLVPEHAQAVVLFAHGSGSSRHSPRNQFVASTLRAAGLATLLFDLLSAEEEAEDRVTAQLRFDVPLLAERLLQATRWLRAQPEGAEKRLGYFGASTGAAAALVAAAQLPGQVQAVVSRGGRPDLAGPALAQVQAPTLLLVGGNDDVVIELNQQALAQLHCEKQLLIVPGATHLFEEPGTLEEVARLAAAWFQRFLGAKQQ